MSIPCAPASTTVPGVFSVFRSNTWARQSFTGSPVSATVEAPGQGISPRIWSWISRALRPQSTGDRALVSMGARVWAAWSWGVWVAAPVRMVSTASTNSAPPISASRS